MTLVTPTQRAMVDPGLAMVTSIIGAGRPVGEIGPGLFKLGHWSPEHTWNVQGGWEAKLWNRDVFNGENSVPESSVVDSPEQWEALYAEQLRATEEPYCCFFVHIAKDPTNKGEGDGWRWHKWGQYVGDGTPECEYLDDEEGFADGVWTASVYQVNG